MNGMGISFSLAGRIGINLIVCLMVAGPCLATAQEYRDIDTDEEVERLAPGLRLAKGRIFSDSVQLNDPVPPGGPLADKFQNYEEAINAWYRLYRLPLFTQVNSGNEDAASMRSEFNRDLRSCRAAAAHEHIADLLQRAMLTICHDEYHPAVRYNAMLMLGDLNSTEAVRVGQNQAPPVPLLPALISMLDEFESEEQIDAVRVAAMIGILRHVELAPFRSEGQSLPASLTTRIIEPMIALVQAETSPDGRSPEGHEWMQRQAIEILGAFGKEGEEGVVLTVLASKLNNDSLSLPIRCAVIQSLAKFEPGLAGNLDSTRILAQAGKVGIDAVRYELLRIQTWEESRDQNGEGAVWDAELELQITSLRRRLKVRLSCVQQGIVGPPGIGALAITPDQQELAQDLRRDLDRALTALDKALDEEEEFTSHEKLDLIRDSLQQAGRDLDATVREALASVAPSVEPVESEPTEGNPTEPDPGSDLPG